MLTALLLTQSAGALLIGAPLGLAAVLLLIFGTQAWRPLAVLIALAAAALPLLLQSPRFARLLDPLEGTNFIRVRVWQSAVAAIRDHPMTGLGLDQFLYFFRGRYILPDAWLEPDLSHPHNIVLDVWLRLGILGVVVMTGLLALVMRALLSHARRLRGQDTHMWALAVGATGATIALIGHGLVDNSVFVIDLVYVSMLVVGLAAALDDVDPNPA
jgi:O-antigen ligase